MRIAFLGFGEAGRAFHDSLTGVDPSLEFAAYDIKLDDAGAAPAMREAMQSRGVAIAPDRAAIAGADWIVSAVTADQSHAALEPLAPHLTPGRWLIDINSVAPDTKRANAALIGESGAAYLDMAVMAPVDPNGHRTPVLLAGAATPALLAEFDRLQWNHRVVGPDPGAAAAIKMVRSLFVKGIGAITVETLLAAEASGCFDEIYDSLSTSFPGLGWPDFAAHQFERLVTHGRRRAAEMRECAATVSDLGLNGSLAGEIASIDERMAGLAEKPPEAGDLEPGVAALLARRLAASK